MYYMYAVRFEMRIITARTACRSSDLW